MKLTHKRILISLITLCIGGWISAFAYTDVLHSYAQQLYENAGFPRKNYARKTFTDQAPYDSIYLDVDPKEFYALVKKRDGDFKIKVSGIIESRNNEETLGIQDFEGKLELRGNISQTCGKPSFKLKTDNQTIKLKSSCGSYLGLEEVLFHEIMGGTPYGWDVFTKQLEIKKLYINNLFYWIYIQVPTLNEAFLKDFWINNPSEDRTCIIQAEKLYLKEDKPLHSNLFTTQDHFTFSNLRKVFEIEHGEKEYCFDRLEKLIYQLKDGLDAENYKTDNINTDSVLARGIANIVGGNRDAFTHNYLLILHEDTRHMGTRDAEHFKGCSSNSYQDYLTKPKYQNAFFHYVLQSYLKKNKQNIENMQGDIRKAFCNKKIYNIVKKEDLKYIVFDRYIRNAGHLTSMDKATLPYIQWLQDIYNGEKNFVGLLQDYYGVYRNYFGFEKEEE